MTTKNLFLPLVLLSVAAISQAQTNTTTATTPAGTSFGIRAGINMQNISGKNLTGGNLGYKLKTGFNIGANAEIPVAPDYFIQAGLLFSTKGAKINSDKVNLAYLELPVNFLYKPLLGANRLLLGFGPYIAYAVGGKYKPASGNSFDIVFKSTVSYTDPLAFYAKRFDAGANFLAGYELSSRLSLQINAQLGLTKINPKYQGVANDKSSGKNTGFGLSAGYRF